ncbi:unnamed protein product [Clonostachys rhizophaga]|uniref:Uncharacterized protein n=1 Tax=Clonostachys rhizophaga TaxID=160324 RepID=A0A9N9YNF4_9HYPO|nr:unnamed protein product [Clonostachys rhizophaga]
MDIAGFFWYNMALLTVLGIAIITAGVLGILTCCRARRRDDLARSALPWLKATASMTILSQLFWLIGSGLLMIYYAFTSSPSSLSSSEALELRLAYLKNLASFFRKPENTDLFSNPIISPIAIGQVQCFALLFEVVASALFIATQFEFTLGLQALSETASSLDTSASSVDTTASSISSFFKMKPRVWSLAPFITIMVLATGLFAAQQVYVTGSSMSANIINAFVLVVYIALALAAIASLAFTILKSRGFPYGHKELRYYLLSLNSITVTRHICTVVLAGMSGGYVDGLWKGQSDGAPFVRVIATHLLSTISLGIAYGIATKKHEGLWASEIYRHYVKA